ncbi:hypothetical protein HDE_04916 [Halotydeus destructor]|nr:hypothetical protein HDE_04916 [Halotydeus destructor]
MVGNWLLSVTLASVCVAMTNGECVTTGNAIKDCGYCGNQAGGFGGMADASRHCQEACQNLGHFQRGTCAFRGDECNCFNVDNVFNV